MLTTGSGCCETGGGEEGLETRSTGSAAKATERDLLDATLFLCAKTFTPEGEHVVYLLKLPLVSAKQGDEEPSMVPSRCSESEVVAIAANQRAEREPSDRPKQLGQRKTRPIQCERR